MRLARSVLRVGPGPSNGGTRSLDWRIAAVLAFPLILGGGTCITGEYTRIGAARPPKPEGTPVAIFLRGKTPKRTYQPLAKLHVRAKESKSDWPSVSAELSRLARQVGADAVIEVVVKQDEEPPISHSESTAPPHVVTTADVKGLAVVWTGGLQPSEPRGGQPAFPPATNPNQQGGRFGPGRGGMQGLPPPPPNER
jgi:hypothetical protein